MSITYLTAAFHTSMQYFIIAVGSSHSMLQVPNFDRFRHSALSLSFSVFLSRFMPRFYAIGTPLRNPRPHLFLSGQMREVVWFWGLVG